MAVARSECGDRSAHWGRRRGCRGLPVAAGLGGLIIPVSIYLSPNAARPTAHGWGAAMSTDTAFALGMLALTEPRFPDRVHAFLLSVAVVDDLVSLIVISAAYSKAIAAVPLVIAAGFFAVILILRRARIRYGLAYAVLVGIAAWVAVLESGTDPVVVGLVMGLLTFAYPAARTDLECAPATTGGVAAGRMRRPAARCRSRMRNGPG
jgi:Na+/H+ antiporter NhaA